MLFLDFRDCDCDLWQKCADVMSRGPSFVAVSSLHLAMVHENLAVYVVLFNVVTLQNIKSF